MATTNVMPGPNRQGAGFAVEWAIGEELVVTSPKRGFAPARRPPFLLQRRKGGKRRRPAASAYPSAVGPLANSPGRTRDTTQKDAGLKQRERPILRPRGRH